jgi:hypothetical protein
MRPLGEFTRMMHRNAKLHVIDDDVTDRSGISCKTDGCDSISGERKENV